MLGAYVLLVIGALQILSDGSKDWTCKDKDKDKEQAYKDQDKDKDFTYSYLLQVAAKPTITTYDCKTHYTK